MRDLDGAGEAPSAGAVLYDNNFVECSDGAAKCIPRLDLKHLLILSCDVSIESFKR